MTVTNDFTQILNPCLENIGRDVEMLLVSWMWYAALDLGLAEQRFQVEPSAE